MLAVSILPQRLSRLQRLREDGPGGRQGTAERHWTWAAASAAPPGKPARRSLEEAQEGKGWSSTDVASRPALRVCLDFGELLKKED